jgi:DNA modification methylase
MLIQADARHIPLADGSVHCCVTSPPYFSLRSYLDAGDPLKCHEVGGEQSVEDYVNHIVIVAHEIARVLRDDGTLWLNLGDTYAGGGNYRGNSDLSDKQRSNRGCHGGVGATPLSGGLKPKDLCMIPARVALALQESGWYLRSDIIWSKPNPMPESVTDRPTTSHEHLFLLAKRERYYYDADAIREPALQPAGDPRKTGDQSKGESTNGRGESTKGYLGSNQGYAGRNARSVWTIATQPFSGAHFATFPPALVEPCVRAGSSERGCCPICGNPWRRVVERTAMVIDRSHNHPLELRTRTSGTMVEPPLSTALGWRPTCAHDAAPCPATILDPFCGSGTTGVVATRNGRRFVGLDLSGVYLHDIAAPRLAHTQPALLGVLA